MTLLRSGLVAVVATVVSSAACSYSQPKPSETGESTEVTPPPKEEPSSESSAEEPSASEEDAPAAPTGACDDRKCSVDQDCCDGFGCSLDPARSRVQRYCLPK